MTLSHEDVRKLLALLDQSDFDEVHIELGDLKLDLRRRASVAQGSAPAREATPQPSRASEPAVKPPAPPPRAAGTPAQPIPPTPIPAGVTAVTAPMIGTFYRAPSPGAKPFVEVGDHVEPDSTVCLIEVMKLFNSLKAGAAGTVEQILADNATLVAAGQPLIFIRQA